LARGRRIASTASLGIQCERGSRHAWKRLKGPSILHPATPAKRWHNSMIGMSLNGTHLIAQGTHLIAHRTRPAIGAGVYTYAYCRLCCAPHRLSSTAESEACIIPRVRATRNPKIEPLCATAVQSVCSMDRPKCDRYMTAEDRMKEDVRLRLLLRQTPIKVATDQVRVE
jgi:hypothetical protein